MDDETKKLKTTDIVAFNKCAEAEFVSLLSKLCARGGVAYSTALTECAFELDVSIETVKRYIAKHTASRAEFALQDGFIFLRPKKR